MVVSRMIRFSFYALQWLAGSVICSRNTAVLRFFKISFQLLLVLSFLFHKIIVGLNKFLVPPLRWISNFSFS